MSLLEFYIFTLYHTRWGKCCRNRFDEGWHVELGKNDSRRLPKCLKHGISAGITFFRIVCHLAHRAHSLTPLGIVMRHTLQNIEGTYKNNKKARYALPTSKHKHMHTGKQVPGACINKHVTGATQSNNLLLRVDKRALTNERTTHIASTHTRAHAFKASTSARTQDASVHNQHTRRHTQQARIHTFTTDVHAYKHAHRGSAWLRISAAVGGRRRQNVRDWRRATGPGSPGSGSGHRPWTQLGGPVGGLCCWETPGSWLSVRPSEASDESSALWWIPPVPSRPRSDYGSELFGGGALSAVGCMVKGFNNVVRTVIGVAGDVNSTQLRCLCWAMLPVLRGHDGGQIPADDGRVDGLFAAVFSPGALERGRPVWWLEQIGAVRPAVAPPVRRKPDDG